MKSWLKYWPGVTFFVLVLAVGIFVAVAEYHNKQEINGKIHSGETAVAQLKEEQNSAPEGFSSHDLAVDIVRFNALMRGYEDRALGGHYPNGQPFDEDILPLVFKFYTAASIGALDKDLTYGFLKRAQDFMEGWKHTYADSDAAIPALRQRLLNEIRATPTPETSNQGVQKS